MIASFRSAGKTGEMASAVVQSFLFLLVLAAFQLASPTFARPSSAPSSALVGRKAIPVAELDRAAAGVEDHGRWLIKKRQPATTPEEEEEELEEGWERRAISPRFAYGQKGSPVRGVNLGGWLVLEPFITPSVFKSAGSDSAIRDEWTFAQLGYRGDRSASLTALKAHQSTFITEQDFAQMSSYGLNHVRIPIGYWAFGTNEGEPWLVADQWSLLKQSATWAAKHGIKIMVDLHGAQGSQNGFDHSGHYGNIKFQYNPTYVNNTINIIRTMADEFSQAKYSNSVASINVLNEPVGGLDLVESFYRRTYNVIRKRSNSLFVVFDDGFKGPDYWAGRFDKSTYEGMALDSHVYTIFTDSEIMLNVDARMRSYCSKKASYASRNVNSMAQILGEFSAPFTDCAVWLNGRGQGARYDGTLANTQAYRGSCDSKRGPASSFSSGYKSLLGRFHQIQRELGEAGAGWISWTWKTEAGTAEDWSYIKGVQNGWIPQNLNNKLYTDTCSQYGY